MNNKTTKIVVVGWFVSKAEKPYYDATKEDDAYYADSWGALFARRLKIHYPDIDIEVWRPDDDFTETYYRNALGVDCTIFPFKNHLFSRTITLEMLKRLWKYQQGYNLVIHFNTIFDWKFNILLPLLLPKAKFVISHHGGLFPSGTNIKNKLKRKLIHYSYRNIDAITYLRETIRNEIASKNKKIKLTFLPVGANFDIYTPLDKTDCRQKLNLPLDKTLAIYVGAFYKLKGVDKILNIFHQLKDSNFEVLFVGGQESDELYTEVIASGCKHWGFVNHNILNEIYSAADFYIHPAFNPDFGGFDVVWAEALACNIPVLSPQFKELDFDYSELGVLLDNESKLLEKTKLMIKSFSDFKKCRETAIRHLNGNTVIIDKLYKILNSQSCQTSDAS